MVNKHANFACKKNFNFVIMCFIPLAREHSNSKYRSYNAFKINAIKSREHIGKLKLMESCWFLLILDLVELKWTRFAKVGEQCVKEIK